MLDDHINKEIERLSNLPSDKGGMETPKKKISGLVENYKEPLGSRILTALFEGDPKTIVTSLINEVAIPKTKDILADLFIGGIEKAIYGDDADSGTRSYYSGYSSKSQSARRSSYEAYYNNRSGRYYTQEPAPQETPRVRWDRIIMRTRPEAMELLTSLRKDISRYTFVSVLQLYDYVTDIDEELGAQIDAEFPDNNWGWTNLDRVQIESVKGGFWVKFPKPVQIN
jgi:hypothetical protein